MGWAQIISGTALVLVLLVVGGVFVRNQWRTLRYLARDATSPLDELIHHRRQAYRRLVAGVLMLLLALLLGGALLYLEEPAQALADARDAFPDPEKRPELTGAELTFARLWGWYWLVLMVLLLALVVVGGWDYLAVRRFGQVQRHKISEARRAMIAREANRLRAEREAES